jgi:GNAT superfamily N-acetyltransferase
MLFAQPPAGQIGSTRVAVTVTFLRMDAPSAAAPRPLPGGVDLVRLTQPSLTFYRYLYGTVGADHLWWLRRAMSDEQLAGLLADPALSVWVLYRDGEPAGFFELDRRQAPLVNLSYFGLMPHATGQGLGSAFLRAAIDEAWTGGTKALTVNTCTADHPRALPGYLRAGFRPIRTVREMWDVPARLGMRIPDHLRS